MNVSKKSVKEDRQIEKANSHTDRNTGGIFPSHFSQTMQSTYGNRFTEAFVRQVSQSTQPRIQKQPSLNHVIQRDVRSDLEEGGNYLDKTSGYQGNVYSGMKRYAKNINDLDGGEYSQQSNAMANGFKKWSENYYNKTQAYLYEVQIAQNATKLPTYSSKKQVTNSFAMLGTDTKTEPDLTVYQQDIALENDKAVEKGTRSIAVEVKASTSDLYATVDDLVAGGAQQLKKREDTNKYSHLRLVIHLDNGKNTWPLTASMATTATSDGTIANQQTWDDRLKERMQTMKGTYKITKPLTVEFTSTGGRSEVEV